MAFNLKVREDLASHAGLKFISSFDVEGILTAQQIKDRFRAGFHCLAVTETFLAGCMAHATTNDGQFTPPSMAIWKCSQSCRDVALALRAGRDADTHSETCEEFAWFTARYPPSQGQVGIWRGLMATSLNPNNNPNFRFSDAMQEFARNLPSDDILASLLSIPQNKTRATQFLVRAAYYLRRQRNWSVAQVCAELPLNIHQVRHAIRNGNRGKLSQPYVEQRGRIKKLRRKLTPEKLAWLKAEIEGNPLLLVRELRAKFCRHFLDTVISRQGILNALKKDLGKKYRCLKPCSPAKNTTSSITYRHFFVHNLLHHYQKATLIVAIDETSFSFYGSSRRGYVSAGQHVSVADLCTNTLNLTLLLACSQEGIVGYYLLEGSIDSIIYADFLRRLHTRLGQRWPGRRCLLTMDNARAHTSRIVRAVCGFLKLPVMMCPAYSPEIHHIEHLFQRIKNRYRQNTDAANR